jgi:hypothetical protein
MYTSCVLFDIYGFLCADEEVCYTESPRCENDACSDRCKKEATELGYKVVSAACRTDVKCCCTFHKQKAPGPLPLPSGAVVEILPARGR